MPSKRPSRRGGSRAARNAQIQPVVHQPYARRSVFREAADNKPVQKGVVLHHELGPPGMPPKFLCQSATAEASSRTLDPNRAQPNVRELNELGTTRQRRLLRLPPHLADLPVLDRRRPAVRVAQFELFERSAERLAQLEIGLRAEANWRHAKVPPARSKGIGDLGERMHLGPPLCDPAYDAFGLVAAALPGDPRETNPFVSITQDSRPRVPVRGRHSSSWDEKSDKGEVAVATSNRHFALAHEIGKQFVSTAGNAPTFVTLHTHTTKLDTSLATRTAAVEIHQPAKTHLPKGSRISLSPPLLASSSPTPILQICCLQAVSRPILTHPAARPILPPSPDQVDAGPISRLKPAPEHGRNNPRSK